MKRGPNWVFGKEDGNQTGTIINVYSDGWVEVKWDNGLQHDYRVGAEDKFDVILVKGVDTF